MRAHLKQRAVREDSLRDAFSREDCAVAGVQVPHHPPSVIEGDGGMATRRSVILEGDLDVRIAPDHGGISSAEDRELGALERALFDT